LLKKGENTLYKNSILIKNNMLFKKPFAKIIGTGVYLPKRIVSNSELEKFLGNLESGWIERRTGIKERRWCCEDEDMFYMSVEAANMALKDAQVKDFDTLIVARSRFTDSRSFVNAGAVHEGLKSKGYKLDLWIMSTVFMLVVGR